MGTSWLWEEQRGTNATCLWSTPDSEVGLLDFECGLSHPFPSSVHLCSVSSPEIVYALPCRIIVKIEYFHAHEVSRPLLGILLLCYLSTPPRTHIPGILGPLQMAEVGPLSYLNLLVRQTQSHLQGTGVVVSGQACDQVFGGICGACTDRSLNLA